jgi:hypothetical protein
MTEAQQKTDLELAYDEMCRLESALMAIQNDDVIIAGHKAYAALKEGE